MIDFALGEELAARIGALGWIDGATPGDIMAIRADDLIEHFSKALANGTAACFVGAGLSRGSGFVDWRGLLREPAASIGLDIDTEHDLPAIAEYYVQQRGNRGSLTQHLVDSLKLPLRGTENHRILARLPVREIWTTNFDSLIEDTFESLGRHCDVKRRDNDFAHTVPNHSLRIYKMHGDLTHPEDVVITRSDYDEYESKYPLMASRFVNAIAETTLLFVGFGMEDPNFRSTLGRHAARFRKSLREHFAVLLEPPGDEVQRKRFVLFVDNLQRNFNIQTVLIREPTELTEILRRISARQERPPKVLLGQVERNRFIVERLESLLSDPEELEFEIYLCMVFSSFAISDDPAYRAAEPISSDEHMQAILRERDILLSLQKRPRTRLKLLLCPPPYQQENRIRYMNLLRWLDANTDTTNVEVRCTSFDFTNMLIVRKRFCVMANYNPSKGYHENRVYEDDGNIEHFVRHFASLFERANIARDTHEARDFYRDVLKRGTYRQSVKWTTVDRKELHAWRNLSLVSASAEVPGRGERQYVYVRHPGSVIVVPLLADGRVVLVNQYRYLLNERSLEFPAGQIEPDEAPEEAAARELEEETGYRAASITRLGSFFTSNSLTDERMTVFLASELEKAPDPVRAEDSVDIEHKIVPFADMGELIRKGEINDGPTIACAQYLFERLRT